MQERGIDGGMGAVIGLTDEQVHEIVDAAREHGEIGVANRQRPGPDRPVRRDPGPGLRPRDEQDGRRPQGGAPDGQRGQPLPADAPRPRRVRPDPGQGARSAIRRVPMLGNVHASVIQTADGLRRELTEHLVHGVQWTETSAAWRPTA